MLFDRDGTLVHDVPFNGDPHRVTPLTGARPALDRLRRAGIAVGIVTNQSGVGRGLITSVDVDRVNQRVEQLLGPFACVEVCPHAPWDGCSCRKPAPGLVVRAATRLGVRTELCLVVGDRDSDLRAASAVGARGLLVPSPDVDLMALLDDVLSGRW